MSSYGRQKAFAAIILTITIIIALRITADILVPEPSSLFPQTIQINK